jgi:ligand-binding sensor domain-containing protein
MTRPKRDADSVVVQLFQVFFLASAAWGGDLSQYHLRNWQTDAGLPHNTVQAVVQTRDGYLWVGTQYGLARFDGTRFTVFRRSNVPEMRNPNIIGLRAASDGTLWIATGSGGVLRLRDGNFVHFGTENGLPHDWMLGPVLETPDGAIWVGSMGGLSRIKDDKITNFDQKSGLVNNAVRDLCLDRAGNLWIGTGGGLDSMGSDGVIHPAPIAHGMKGADVRAICCDSEGTIWVGAGNELHQIRDGRHTAFPQGAGLPYNIIRRLCVDREGNLWVGSYGGLSRFVAGEFIPQLGADGLPFDLVTGLFEDREANLWVGSRDGLTQCRAPRFTTYTARQGVPNNNVMSVLEDHASTIWIATWGGGVSALRNGVFTMLTNRPRGPALALALHEDRSGCLWAGTDYSGGLFRFNDQSVQHFTPAQGLPGKAIRAIYEDSRSNLWVGTSEGLYVGKEGRFAAYAAEPGLGSVIARDIHEDRLGNIWVGTDHGLWRLGSDKRTKYTKQDGLSEDDILSLYEDRAGELWIGTARGGLNWYHDGGFVSFMTDNGLFHNTICEILEDDQGSVWMSCPRGVFRVKRSDLEAFARDRTRRLESFAYGKADGMASELCNGVAKPGAWKSKDGRLWFATSKGVSVIDPGEPAHEDRSPPEVIIERIVAGKQSFPSQETLTASSPIEIAPGNGELEFDYTALCFRAPEKNQFRYRLEGLKPDWVEAGASRVAWYHNLSPGTYRFHVTARNNNGLWNESGAVAEITLLPHFWQTSWFHVSAALAAGLVIFGLHRFHVAHLREIDRFRLRLAADLHDDVGSNLSTISLLSRRAQKSAAGKGAVEDIATIHRISRQTANAIREIVWLINPEYDTMQDLVTRMKDAADSILTGIDCRFEAPPAALSHKLTLQFRQNVFLLYKEALTNVARHAQASRVDIAVAQHDHTCEVRVHDNGVGFDPQASHNGNGLKNLRLRAAKLKGELTIDSGPDRGTTISLSAKHS